MDFLKQLTIVIIKLTFLEKNQISKPANTMTDVKEINNG